MVIVEGTVQPECYMKFDASVYLLYHPTSCIAPGFQCTVHVGSVRQTATLEAVHTKEVVFLDLFRVFLIEFV